MVEKKTILFLSALDFKEKSIQVIRKTPEAYAKSGWEVYYVVARDNSRFGNYFYEREVNPECVNVYRFYMPLTKIYEKIENHTLRTILSKLRAYITIIKLAYFAYKVLKKNKIDIIYGYEVHGVLAVNILKLLGKLSNQKIISRFQGTRLIKFITDKNIFKKIFKIMLNWDEYLALKLPSDLCIMTDDGTHGDLVLKYIKSKNLKNLKFWVNGVDELKIPVHKISELKKKMGIQDEIIFLTVCRLVSWKRVDRGIMIIEKLVKEYNIKNIKYYIVGDGNERSNLEKMVKERNLDKYIIFVGAINNENVKYYLNISDIFISTYDLSNVGNPLFEAIRSNKIIFTLNNGDTNKWIQHRINGFIYDIDDNLISNIANGIFEVWNNQELREKILTNIKLTEKEKLWTWEERLNAEINEVCKLLKNEN